MSRSGHEPVSLPSRQLAAGLAALKRALGERPQRGLDTSGLEPAAVLVPLFADAGETGLVLTRRTEALARHAGEIAFPGGRADPDDADPAATALREAQEEIGLAPSAATILGMLDPRATVTHFAVTPVVAALADPCPLVADPAEVEEILHVRLAELSAAGAHRVERWRRDGRELDVHFYELREVTVWGATARIIAELLPLARACGLR